MNRPVSSQTLETMQAYYKERAHEYDEWFYRQGRYNRSTETNARWFAETDEVFAAFDAFQLTGDVLELACGTGIWTERLLRTASTITAVDAASEMLEINYARVASKQVSYVQADLFSWHPGRVYDAVLFSFWISHVPLERLDGFLHSVANMLRPGGKIFFVDTRREASSTAQNQQLPKQDNQIMMRKLNDGRTFEIVKNFYDPVDLAMHCKDAGIDISIYETATYFLYGYGYRH
jgi:demethylmenaquinone methyltransferase/2-methoxy-6-polyprenyl-1,4-benzoquinol methylase